MCLCQPAFANWPCKTQILNGASQRKKPEELISNQTLLQKSKFSFLITFCGSGEGDGVPRREQRDNPALHL